MKPPQQERKENRSVILQILDEIGQREGKDPLEFDRPLYDAIDTDILDSLFSGDGIEGHVTFSYLEYQITVEDEGNITVTEQSA